MKANRSLILASMLLMPCTSLLAQQPTEAAKAAPVATQFASETQPTTSATPDAPGKPADEPAKPSDDTIKKARAAGYKPEVRSGITQYCRVDASLGTHFRDKKCVSEQQLTEVMNIQGETKDQLRQVQACAGGACKGN